MAAGLPDPVHDSQQAFRAALDALARPGQIQRVGGALPDVALGGAMARLLLSLSDADSPVWWQGEMPVEQEWLRFHTGADLARQADSASFAVMTSASRGVTLANFAQGTAAAPEFSTTLVIELPSLEDGVTLEWRGPGIQTVQAVKLAGLPEDFWPQWQANHAAFPQGVDILLTCGEHALGLPRTTRVRRWEGV